MCRELVMSGGMSRGMAGGGGVGMLEDEYPSPAYGT